MKENVLENVFFLIMDVIKKPNVKMEESDMG